MFAHRAITHGLPDSGKSFVSQGVVEEAGAIGVRPDVERKRLFGLGALETSRGRVPGGIYDSGATKHTYSRLAEIATVALEAGWPVVVDAAFLRRSERAEFAALAESLAVPFTVFDCRAELSELRRRIEQRQEAGTDPSEADVAVLERLVEADEPLDDSERAGASSSVPSRPRCQRCWPSDGALPFDARRPEAWAARPRAHGQTLPTNAHAGLKVRASAAIPRFL